MVDAENNVILVKGNIPGPKKGLVIIKSAVKNPDKVNERPELVSWIVEETPMETTETATEEVAEETVEETAEEATTEEVQEEKEETPKEEK